MVWKVRFLGSLLWALGGVAMAQAPDLGAPLITNFEPEQYKAHSQNWVALQDGRGVMYFGNSSGILEFDGQHWQLIPVPGNPLTRALASGPDGTIYFGAIGDLGYLSTSPSGKVYAVSLKESIPVAERSFNDVMQVQSSGNGIYFLTLNRIFRFHGGRMTVLPSRPASEICVLNGTLFFADLEKGLCALDGDQVLPIPPLAGVPFGKRIYMMPFDHHELLVGLRTGDFRRLDLSSFWDQDSRRYDLTRPAPRNMVQPFPCEAETFLKESQALLYKLVPLGRDAFAIVTLKAGILVSDRTGKILRVINKDEGLLDNTVLNLALDRSNNLWASTNMGISHIEWSVPQSGFGARDGIDGLSLSVCFHKGRLYVGTFQNIFIQQAPHRFNPKDNRPVFRALKDSPNEVWHFLEVEGDLMAASSSGLFRIQGGAAFKLPGSHHALVLSTSRRWPGHLFVGSRDGIDAFKRTSGRWSLVGRLDGIKEKIWRIAEDAQGDLWASTDAQGLLRIHFTGAKPTETSVHRLGPEQGLPGLTTLRASFHGSTLYAVSPKGLFRATIQPWNSGGAEQTRFQPDPILGKTFNDPPMNLTDMVSDGKGGFFISTSEGMVWALPGKDGQFQATTRPFQGVPAPDVMFYLHPEGSVWLPGKVLYRVDPWASKDYDQGFQVLIRKVVATTNRLVFEGTHAREGQAFGSQRTVFQNLQGKGEIPELPYNLNALSFEFSASFFEKPGTTRFQYLLEGFQKEWSGWGPSTFKEFTNLPPGPYRFRVQAKNLYDTPGQEAAFAFRILRPWWMTWWARGLGSIALGLPLASLSAWLAFRARLRQLAIRNAVLAERNRLAQELHDGVGQGLAGIILLCSDAEKEAELVEYPGAASIRGIRAAASDTLQESRAALQALRPTNLEAGLQEALARLFRRVERGIEVDFRFLGEPRPLPLLLEHHLYRIAEEALANVLRHAGATGIELGLAWTWRSVRLSVQDNGRGFEVEGKRTVAAGSGLPGIAQRAAALGARLTLASSPGKGTRLQVVAPIPLWAALRHEIRRRRHRSEEILPG